MHPCRADENLGVILADAVAELNRFFCRGFDAGPAGGVGHAFADAFGQGVQEIQLAVLFATKVSDQVGNAPARTG